MLFLNFYMTILYFLLLPKLPGSFSILFVSISVIHSELPWVVLIGSLTYKFFKKINHIQWSSIHSMSLIKENGFLFFYLARTANKKNRSLVFLKLLELPIYDNLKLCGNHIRAAFVYQINHVSGRAISLRNFLYLGQPQDGTSNIHNGC